MKTRALFPAAAILAVFMLIMTLIAPASVRAQGQAQTESAEGKEADPAAALSAALSAACRMNADKFALYLTTDNAVAFRALPQEQRTSLMKRLSLADNPGKPLLSSDAHNHIVFRCEAQEGTAEFRFG